VAVSRPPISAKFKNACVVKLTNCWSGCKSWSILLSGNWLVVWKWVPEWDDNVVEGGIKLAFKSKMVCAMA
jgi:hypothetical protein